MKRSFSIPMSYIPEYLYEQIAEWLSDHLAEKGITGSYSYKMGDIVVRYEDEDEN